MRHHHHTKYWIQEAHGKKGSLHRHLHIPQGEKIPEKELHEIGRAKVGKRIDHFTVTRKIKKEAQFALNVRGLHHHGHHRR